MRVLVCGRGASLTNIDIEELNVDFDYVFLVNEFNDFIRMNGRLRKFLEGKKVIQQVNICQTGVDNYLLETLDVEKVYISRLEPNGSHNWWRQGRISPAITNLDVKSGYQSNELEPYMEAVENSSDIAILNAIIKYGATEVYTIGIDFYQTIYFLGMNEADYNECSSKEVQNKIMTSHAKIISEFSDVQFTYVTCAKFNPELPNFKLVKVYAYRNEG